MATGVALLKLVAHLALHFSPNFVKLMVLKDAIAQSSIVNHLEIFCKSLKCLFAKLAARVDVLHPVAHVEGHKNHSIWRLAPGFSMSPLAEAL